MLIKVDTKGFVPLYEQIKAEVRRLAVVGAVRAHDALPSIRELAAELMVNPNTVARAYRELEKEGLITTQKGRGSYIAARSSPELERDIESHLNRVLDEAIREGRRFNLGPRKLRKLFEDRLRKTGGEGREGGQDD